MLLIARLSDVPSIRALLNVFSKKKNHFGRALGNRVASALYPGNARKPGILKRKYGIAFHGY